MTEPFKLSNLIRLNFLTGNTPDDLLAQLQQISLPVQIVSIYAVGSRHCAWFHTDAKIVKKTKEKPQTNGA